MSEGIFCRYYDSPFGRLKLGAFDGRLCLCCWCDSPKASVVERRVARRLQGSLVYGDSIVTDRAAAALDAFFDGDSCALDIPLLLPGTDFQRRVWFGLSFVGYGSTVSYGEVSRFATGGVSAVRAVASAVGDNPVNVFVPCHRVVGCNGNLTGYAGGLRVKAGLLELERGTPRLF